MYGVGYRRRAIHKYYHTVKWSSTINSIRALAVGGSTLIHLSDWLSRVSSIKIQLTLLLLPKLKTSTHHAGQSDIKSFAARYTGENGSTKATRKQYWNGQFPRFYPPSSVPSRPHFRTVAELNWFRCGQVGQVSISWTYLLARVFEHVLCAEQLLPDTLVVIGEKRGSYLPRASLLFSLPAEVQPSVTSCRACRTTRNITSVFWLLLERHWRIYSHSPLAPFCIVEGDRSFRPSNGYGLYARGPRLCFVLCVRGDTHMPCKACVVRYTSRPRRPFLWLHVFLLVRIYPGTPLLALWRESPSPITLHLGWIPTYTTKYSSTLT